MVESSVKRLYFNNKHRTGDFYNEVNIISSVEHKNQIRLLACSCLPNMSLNKFIISKQQNAKKPCSG